MNQKDYCNAQADYFEREEQEEHLRKRNVRKRNLDFNKKQFLKDCGVEQ